MECNVRRFLICMHSTSILTATTKLTWNIFGIIYLMSQRCARWSVKMLIWLWRLVGYLMVMVHVPGRLPNFQGIWELLNTKPMLLRRCEILHKTLSFMRYWNGSRPLDGRCRNDSAELLYPVVKLGQFAMSESYNWLGVVNSGVYYARQTREIYQVLPYSVAFKASWEL